MFIIDCLVNVGLRAGSIFKSALIMETGAY
jgi:hypothetical protein